MMTISDKTRVKMSNICFNLQKSKESRLVTHQYYIVVLCVPVHSAWVYL